VNHGILAGFVAFIARYIEINATALFKAVKIFPKEKDRIKVGFPTIAFIGLPKALMGATTAGQTSTGATFDGGNQCQIKKFLK
jgi:hypothetical protein